MGSPAAFLDALAKRLHTTAARVPAQRAIEELLGWLEAVVATGRQPPLPFLQVAARLVYEQGRLLLGPTRDEGDALAERLAESRPAGGARKPVPNGRAVPRHGSRSCGAD